jgi:cytochrome P450
MVAWIKEQHEKYGDAVRLAPNDVSFISGETAWPDIYGFRSGKYKNTGAYLKDRAWFPKPINGVYTLLAADEVDHSRIRRNLSHAFSDKALREQEPLIQQYVDLLVHRLGEHAAENKPIDIMRWYNYTTFDVICDLTFGEPLYCLRDSVEHKWIQFVYTNVKGIGLLSIPIKYPIFAYYDKIKNYFKDTTIVARKRLEFFRLSQEKVSKRLEKGTDRPDFFSYIVKGQETEAKAITRAEMDSNAILFLVAGSETTATTLSGTTYLLLSNPDKYAKLVKEIRTKFTSAKDITVEEVNKMDYMIACLQEGLRYYPPVPTGFPRIVPAGGDHISGHFIPEGTSVCVSQHAASHSTRNFKDPETYVPERWLGDEKYADDKRDVVNPFSFGPRNCLGKK